MRSESVAGILMIVTVAGYGGQDRNLQSVVEETGAAVVEGALARSPIRFHSLADGSVDAERGRLEVPVRRDRASADEIAVHFVRFPARTATPGSPIVYLAGGPGGSGTASAAGERFRLFDALREVADVIALDQRGAWNSEPYLVCPGGWSLSPDVPVSVEALSDAMAPWVSTCHRHWTGQGVDLDAFNTRESAADLEDLRIALGAERLSLWAISYGTHLALEFGRSFPDSVDRMVLAGTEGPDHTLKSPAAIDAVLSRMDELLSDLGVAPLTPRVRRLLEMLEEPITGMALAEGEPGPVPVRFGAPDVQRVVFGNIGGRDDLLELSQGLDLVLEGEMNVAAQAVLDWRTGNRGLAMSLAMDCASWASERRLRQIALEAGRASLGDTANLRIRAECASWPGARLPGGFHQPVTSDAPTLFISGAIDVRAPLENAREVAEGFAHAWHLVVRDGGHDDLLTGTPEIGSAIAEFFSGRTPDALREVWLEEPRQAPAGGIIDRVRLDALSAVERRTARYATPCASSLRLPSL